MVITEQERQRRVSEDLYAVVEGTRGGRFCQGLTFVYCKAVQVRSLFGNLLLRLKASDDDLKKAGGGRVAKVVDA